ncbi:dUTP diphosphatase [Candidatus Woesearchaeota archaeon]|nr:dUTP diphosphatase [Candidatus Woesearchaeota archaeon]
MKINVKRLIPDAVLPSYGRPGDAGLDLTTIESHILSPGERRMFSTGLAIAVPEGMVGLVWDRSGMAAKNGIKTMAGVIDCTYRGELKIVLLNTTDESYEIKKGDRIAQLLVQPINTVEVVESDLDDSHRGESGFGSSGR